MISLRLTVSWTFLLFFATKVAAKPPPPGPSRSRETSFWADMVHGNIERGAKTPKSINLYGRQTTLQSLLDYHGVRDMDPQVAFSKYDILINWADRKVPSWEFVDAELPSVTLDKTLEGIQYIEREFLPSSSRAVSKLNPPIVPGDTPSTLAMELITRPGTFAVIKGPEGSGKTVALTKIFNDLRSNPIESWTVMLDASKVNTKELFTGRDIIRQSLGKDATLFYEIISRNPSKIKILIDNLDKVSYNTKVKVVTHLKTLAKEGAGVALTLQNDFFSFPNDKLQVEIPDLTPVETKTLFRRLWTKEFGEARTMEINDYVASISHLMENNEILPVFAARKKLANILAHGEKALPVKNPETSSSIFVGSEESTFMSLEKYITSRTLSFDPSKLLNRLGETKFNKLNLYEKLTEAMPTHTFSNRAKTAFEALKDLMHLTTTTSDSPVRLEMKNVEEYLYVPPGESSLAYRIDLTSLYDGMEYNNYIIGRFLLKAHKNLLGNELMATTKFILENSQFIQIVEFINAALQDPHYQHRLDSFFKKVSTTPAEWHGIMDNLLVHGQDNVAARLVKTVSQVGSPESLKEYFGNGQEMQKTITSDSTFSLGLLKEAPNKITSTRQEMMFRKNMHETIMKVDELVGRNYWESGEFSRYMKTFFLEQSKPSMKMYDFMRSRMNPNSPTGKLPTALANDLLFTTISHSGLKNHYIIDDLVKNGANPKIINENGKTLVHIALEQRDPALLHYIVKELQVPLRDMSNTRSLLITALDSNPLSRFSPPNFWATLNYLIRHGELDVPSRNHPDIGPTDVQPTEVDLKTAAYEVLSGSGTHLDESLAEVRVSESSAIEELSQPLRNLRRNLVLGMANNEIDPSSPKPMTEIILKYRGTEKLGVMEKMFFRDCVVFAIIQDYGLDHHPTIQSQERIVQALFDTVHSPADVHFAKDALNKMINRLQNREPLINIIRTELEVMYNKIQEPVAAVTEPMTLAEKVLLTTKRYEIPEPRARAFESLRTSMQQKFPIVVCGNLRGQRRRRSASGCLLSQSDYDKFVQVDEEGRRVLNTDEFMELMEKFQFENMVKYEQLVELGRALVVEDGLELTGDYMSEFDERIQPYKIDERAIDERYSVNIEEVINRMNEQGLESPGKSMRGSKGRSGVLNERNSPGRLRSMRKNNPASRMNYFRDEPYPNSFERPYETVYGDELGKKPAFTERLGSIPEEPAGYHDESHPNSFERPYETVYGDELGKKPAFTERLGSIPEESPGYHGGIYEPHSNPLENLNSHGMSINNEHYINPSENFNFHERPVINPSENFNFHERPVINPSENFNFHERPVIHPVEPIIFHETPIIHPVEPIIFHETPIIHPVEPIIIPKIPIIKANPVLEVPFPVFKPSSYGIFRRG